LKMFEQSLDGPSSMCLFSIFPTVPPLHLNNWLCIPAQHRHCLLLEGGGCHLRSPAVYVKAAPLSAGQSINTKHSQRFFRCNPFPDISIILWLMYDFNVVNNLWQPCSSPIYTYTATVLI
jgi:hypothetical protein